MLRRPLTALVFALCAPFGILAAVPAGAADGQVIITQNKALAGGVTTGDAAGFPVKLTVAGSYTLGSNLFPGPNRAGIIAAAEDISIDLNGFRISGGPAGGSNNSTSGIVDLGDRLTVKNGTLGAFETAGIHAPNRPYLIVENMRIINSGIGIDNTGGPFARIQNNTIATNIGDGIDCGDSCHIEGNLVSSNGGSGIYIYTGTILGNTIITNIGWGIFAPVANTKNLIGLGNNTITNNHNGDTQVHAFSRELFPNACSPGSC